MCQAFLIGSQREHTINNPCRYKKIKKYNKIDTTLFWHVNDSDLYYVKHKSNSIQ